MVAFWAHNPLVVGSIPIPATKKKIFVKVLGIMKKVSYLYKVIKVEANN